MTIRRIISPVIVDLKDDRGKWHRHIHIRELKTSYEEDKPTLKEG